MVLDGRIVATSSGTDEEEVKGKLLDAYFRRPPAQPVKRRKRKPR